jgi:hypothetical protein
MIFAAEEFDSLPLARAYIDTVRERTGSLGTRELIGALDRVDRAYREFPELARERSRSCFSSAVVLLLDQITRSDSRSSLAEALALFGRFRELRWDAIEATVSVLRQQGRADTIIQIISEVLDRVTSIEEEGAAGFGDLLKYLLCDEPPLEIDGRALAEVVRSARRRLKRPPGGRHEQGSRGALLAMAERLRPAQPPTPLNPHRDIAWPSARLSFDEFLLQWPCEIELPVKLDAAAFIDEAYRAILLRGPDVAERDQYLKLLRDGAVSRNWVIEDLLASEELHSLERRLRVVCGGRVITEPGSSGQEDMPAVIWPSRSAG